MPATEELRVILRTIADDKGAKQVEQSLKGVQQQARLSGADMLKFGAAVSGMNLGLSAAADLARGAIGDSIDAAREHERVNRALTASYGQQTQAWVRFSDQLSATTGFTSDAIGEAALSARTLSQNYGLTTEQTQKLIKVSADLARVRGIGIAESFERVQSAIRGEAEASEYLGLTLNDTYLTNQAMNGSLKTTFGTMTDLQKAQVRYNELLRQSAQFTDLAKSSTDSLDGAFNRAGTSAHNFQVEVGKLTAPAVIAGLNALSDALEFAGKGGVAGAIGRQAEAPRQQAIDRAVKDMQRLKRLNEELAVQPAPPPQGPVFLSEAQRLAAAQERARTMRIRELNENLPPVATAETAAQIALIARQNAALDQVQAAQQDVANAQQEGVRLQQESLQLAAEEARIKLALLPAQREMAELQQTQTEAQLHARLAGLPAREALEDLQRAQQVAQLINQSRSTLLEDQLRARLAALPSRQGLEDLQRAQEVARLVQQTTSDLAENMARARLAALPASEALDDLHYEQERARLIASNRNAGSAARSAARRELRELSRAEPGVALSALDAQRQVSLQGRAGERAGLEQQLTDITSQRELAVAQLAVIESERQQVALEREAQRAGIEQQLADIASQRELAVAQLSAIESERQVLALQRGAERVDIEAQLQAIADALALAPVSAAQQQNALAAAIGASNIQQAQQVLADAVRQGIEAGVTLPIQVNVTINHEDGRVETYTQLIEANQQAAIPPAIQMSGLRRG